MAPWQGKKTMRVTKFYTETSVMNKTWKIMIFCGCDRSCTSRRDAGDDQLPDGVQADCSEDRTTTDDGRLQNLDRRRERLYA